MMMTVSCPCESQLVSVIAFRIPGAKITLDDSFYKRSEGDGSVGVCVELKTEIKREIVFELKVSNINAEGDKYTSFLSH